MLKLFSIVMTRSLTRDVDCSHQHLQDKERKEQQQSATFKFHISETNKAATLFKNILYAINALRELT